MVAAEIAKELGLPLRALVVKKIGAPFQRELAIGAVTEDGVYLVDWDLAKRVGADKRYVEKEVGRLKKEIEKTAERFFQKERTFPKDVILVDDGVATGATVEVGVSLLRKKGVERIILAVPVIAADTAERLAPLVEEMVFLEAPEVFRAVGEFYEDFSQVDDATVASFLEAASLKKHHSKKGDE